MNDFISRQAAIDVAYAVWSVTGDKNVAKVWDQLKDLPFVQPELAQDLPNACTDAISRQAAISAICNACGKIDCDKMDKCEKLQLPPANCSEFPNNSDTADALHTSTDYFLDENYAGMLERTHRNWLESVLKMNDELDVAAGKVWIRVTFSCNQ